MAQDTIRTSIKLLTALCGFVAKPGLLAALQTGQSIHDTLTTMAAAPPTEMSNLITELTKSARRTFESTPHLPTDAAILFEQMVELGLPNAEDIVSSNLQADAISALMLNKLSKFDQPQFREPPMPRLFRSLTVPVFERLLTEKRFTDGLMSAWMSDVSVKLESLGSRLETVGAKQDQTNAMLTALLAKVTHDPRYREEVERRGALVIALARRYAEGNPQDFDDALLGLERALETAAMGRDKGQLLGNISDAVNAVVARVDALNDVGRIDEAATELWDEIERHEAAQGRLLDKGIAQAILTRDVTLAARFEMRKLALGGGGFDELRRVREVWFQRGSNEGLLFDLEVAIALAQESLVLAASPDQRGVGLNDLGVALKTRGEQDNGTDRLEQAVATHKAALLERTRDRVPLDWALTQMNLGNALQTLGSRESGTARLGQAVAAYKAALTEIARDQVPLDWAAAQMNMGIALQTLGERENSSAQLHDAIRAHEDALSEYARNREPLNCATAQMNLGVALRTLGAREGNTDQLKRAIAAFEAALLECTRDQEPLKYASAQMNLANSLATLGEHETGTESWEKAVTAHKAALSEWTKDRAPVNWALAQLNLGGVYLNWHNKAGERSRLDLAQKHLDQAHAEFKKMRSDHYLALAKQLQAQIDERREAMR